MKIELEIIKEDHTEMVLRNANGDTLTYNPFHQTGLEELIQGAKLASDGVLADVSVSLCYKEDFTDQKRCDNQCDECKEWEDRSK